MAIFSYTTDLLNWPFASVLAMVLLAIVVLATYAFTAVTNRLTNRGKWELV
jgi:ABC-type spermidine/putrescine transport system permease subunit I